MRTKILAIVLIGMSFGLKAQNKIESTGNVGIGTTNPNSPLTIGYNNSGNQIVLKRLSGHETFSMNINSSNQVIFKNHSGGGDYDFQTNIAGQGVTSAVFIEGANGNVGIGTKDPKGFRLGVNGKIAAEEVKVALYNNWSDFVFDSAYKLPTLKEVENYIKEKGHLKDIPSAAHVKENGIFLGEMDSKLLQKIEELTLYTIQQEKRINSIEFKNLKLEKENEALKTINLKLFQLQKRLEDLENK